MFNKHFFLVYEITASQLRDINSPKTGYGRFRAKVKGSCELLVIVGGSTEQKAQNITSQKHILTTQEFSDY